VTGDAPFSGVPLLVLAELCFTLSTVVTKRVVLISAVPAVEITFFRFALGAVLSAVHMFRRKSSFRPNNWVTIGFRAVLNSAAVILFFYALQFTTVTNANMLNMTYPVFVFLVSPFINREKSSPLFWLFLGVTMAGIWLVINPAFGSVNTGDILGLSSGIVAGFAISTLKEARMHDGTDIILFYLMCVGTVINGLVVLPKFVFPVGVTGLLVLSAALLGFVGQVFLTEGYRFVRATSGSIVSSSRILFAVFLGVILFHDPLHIRILAGGALILASLAGVSVLGRRMKQWLRSH
jgi:drug/metabolite transporter (DMT)-like permease